MAEAQPVLQGTSLYVGDLDPSVNEAELFECFGAFGQIASIRVCRDYVTRRSLGYAYVNFLEAPKAAEALENLNFEPMKGRPMRIMWSQRNPSLRKSGVGNIFIGNLEKSIDNKTLFDTFRSFGKILSCKVSTDAAGNSRGFGFVHYETQEEADLAIEKVNGMMLLDLKVVVTHFKSKKDRIERYNARASEYTNIYVKNLPEETTDDDLNKMFSEFGEITSRKVVADQNGKSKGFGFVAFKESSAAKAAVEALNDKDYQGKKLYVGRAQKKAERMAHLHRLREQYKAELQSRYKGVNLYVKNLVDDVDDEKLREAFQKFGTITSAKVMKDGNISKNFGFVCFSSHEEATRAVTEMHNRVVFGVKPLYVALAQRKEERIQQLAAQLNQRMKQNPPMMNMYQSQPQPMMYMHMQPPRMMQYRRPMMNPYPSMQPARAGPPQPQQQQQQQQLPQQQRVPGPRPPPMQEYDIASHISNLSPSEAKQFIGDRLYRQINKIEPELSRKVTGMLLEMEQSEQLHVLENHDALKQKVSEAVQTLREHQLQQQQQQQQQQRPNQ